MFAIVQAPYKTKILSVPFKTSYEYYVSAWIVHGDSVKKLARALSELFFETLEFPMFLNSDFYIHIEG